VANAAEEEELEGFKYVAYRKKPHNTFPSVANAAEEKELCKTKSHSGVGGFAGGGSVLTDESVPLVGASAWKHAASTPCRCPRVLEEEWNKSGMCSFSCFRKVWVAL
jgi:hypothetical protein